VPANRTRAIFTYAYRRKDEQQAVPLDAPPDAVQPVEPLDVPLPSALLDGMLLLPPPFEPA
jgi:hypothetical protein